MQTINRNTKYWTFGGNGKCSSFSSYVVDRRAEHWKEYFHEDSVFLLLARKAGDDRWGGDRF